VVLGEAVWEFFGVGAEEVEGADGAGDVAVGAPGFTGVGVVAAGVLGVAGAGAAVVGVPGGGAKTAALALPGRRRASSSTSSDRAALGADAWVFADRRIVLWCPASIAPAGSTGKRCVSRNRVGGRTP
jgi:hypothetical protein